MLDFKELSKDGQDLELLVREILFRKGYSVHWSGKGPDGGRDLVCIEHRDSFFLPDEKRWLIQCKHNATSGKSVGIKDLDNIVDSCNQHDCTGYLLVCSTFPSSTVIQRLESISSTNHNRIVATYWDAVKLEQILSTPKNWPLAQKFFSKSANEQGWQIYGTESPNHWVVNYKGYYFHLSNRIGSYHEHHLDPIRKRVQDIEGISLPKDHFIRIRSVYYDDKNGGYIWYLDYMYPNDQRPVVGTAQLGYALGDGYALEDGQTYSFDIKHRSYFKHSDHYDPDHYDYYKSDAQKFGFGLDRDRDYDAYAESEDSKRKLKEQIESERSRGYDALVAKLSSLSFISLRRSCNAKIEDLDKFHLRRNWSEVIEDHDIETDRFFSAWFIVEAETADPFFAMINHIPQGIDAHFRLTRLCVFLPSEDGKGSVRDDTDDELLYELTLSIHPGCIGNMLTGRSLLNDYFLRVVDGISAYQAAS